MKKIILLLLLIIGYADRNYGQAPGCPDISVDTAPGSRICDPGDCITLTASYFETGATTSYGVSSIPYTPPFSFTGGTELSIGQDDVWSPVITLPFNFCFYGSTYNKVLIGSNGVITFSIAGQVPGGLYSPGASGYFFDDPIPTTEIRPYKNSIFGVLQDTDPFASTSHSLNYQILGTYPCRTLVFNMHELAQFDCDETVGTQTSQIVLYETTNVIEVYVHKRTPCNTHMGGAGVIGIQNANGTLAVAPPDRNTGNWTATDEAWRFTPTGPSNISVDWLSEGILIGSGEQVIVCPATDTSYTARATYTLCDGSQVIKEATMAIAMPEAIPIGDPQDITVCADGNTSVDLTTQNDIILNGLDQSTYIIGLHLSQESAAEGFPPLPESEATFYPIGPGATLTVWARVENFFTGCKTVTSFVVAGVSAPPIGTPVDMVSCEAQGTTSAIYNLLSNDGTILAGQNPALFTVSYHTTSANANNNVAAIADPGAFASVGQEIFARLTSVNNPECFAVTSFSLVLANQPDVTAPADAFTCSDVGYTLPPLAIGNYFTQPTGNGTALVPGNIIYTTQIIYVYEGIDNSCYDEDSFLVTVYPPPVSQVTDFKKCDDASGDGKEIFDLTAKNLEASGNDPSSIVTYYESFAAAQMGPGNEILVPQAYENLGNPQELWVRVASLNGCAGIASFDLVLYEKPIAVTPLTPFYACENQPGIASFSLSPITVTVTNDLPGFTVSYYENENSALSGNGNFIAIDPYPAPTGTIWARVTATSTGCATIVPIMLQVIPSPIATPPAPIAECDINNDCFAEFDMVPSMQAIEAALADVTVTAHETPEDAEFGVNVIPNPGTYLNINACTQTIYLRVKSDLTDCFDIVTLQLIVNPTPEATTPSDYELCDDGTSDTDGFSTFDLTTKAAEIYGNIDPAQFSLTFFADLATANAGTPAIANPLSYLSDTDTVYARVTNNVTGCFDIVALNLIVNPLPVLLTNQYVYRLCETDDPVEVETFDLTTTIPVFIADQNGVEVTYYHSFADANAHTNAIPNPTAYENQELGAETLFVRFTIEATGCYRIGFLDVDVDPKPVILEPTQDELTVCDTNGEGIGEFNLEDLRAGMTNGEPGLVLTFHETLEDAQQGINAIPNTTNYVNTNPYLQTIWVRVSNTITGCSNNEPVMLTLIVEPAPQAPALADITLCDDQDNNGQDNRRLVDLTVQTPIIEAALGLDEPTQLTIEYYTTEAAANAGVGRIINPGAFMGTDGQQIWVRVESPTTACYSLSDFALQFSQPHALTRPAVYSICNEELPNDGVAEFDLTTRDNEILGAAGQGQGYTVNYYDGDPKNGGTLIADPQHYNNPAGPPVVNPKTLYVEVITTEGCKSYTTLTVKVLALPVPDFEPTPLQLCDDNNSPDGVEEFDLTLADSQIRNNGSNYILSYHTTYADADAPIAGLNPIADPTAHESATGEVYVRVQLNTNNPAEERCHQVVILVLIVNPLPPVNNMNVYPVCEQNTDGAADFNIQEFVNNELAKQGVNPADYDVDFFTDAALTTPAIPVNAYPVSGGSATIYVRVVDLVTGCRIVKPLQLVVEEFATATQPADSVLEECDTDGSNDGFFVFDLTQVEAEVLGTQNPADYTVSYHVTLADAEEGDNPIADPTFFANTQVDTQPVWIRVVNNTSVGECDAIVQIDVLVERLPEPVIAGGTICVDKATGAVVRPLLIDTGLTSGTFVWTYTDATGQQTILDETGPSILAQAPGQYNVSATSLAGCVSEPIDAVTVLQSGPAVKIDRGYYVTNYFSDNQTITVTIDGYGVYEYSLDEGPWQSSNIFDNVSPGSHTVRVRDTNPDACDELVITGASIVDYPNFFTPNGDGFHDTWNIIGLADTGSVIYIFDRYGKLIKQISPDSEGWDGTFNGVNVPATDYWFTVTYPEFDGTTTVTKEFKSHFSLKR